MDEARFLRIDDNPQWRRHERTQEIRRQLRLQRRQIMDVSNPFLLDNEYFRRLYRLPKDLALNLINLLHDHLVTQAIPRIPVHHQVLLALRFFGYGCYQKALINDYNHPVSQKTFSRCLHRVTQALNAIAKDWIHFPANQEQRQAVKERFLNINSIPGILGLVDCVVVKFVKPSENEEAFYHHKHSHSMNVQIVSDDNYVITSIRICPGSNNDRFIWRHSDIRQHLIDLRNDPNIVEEEGNYYILGDSGYTPSNILLTPIVDAEEGSPAERYTYNHVRTRCMIEQLFGLFSNVWKAVSRRRVLHYKPEKVAQIILACAVLHNFTRLNGALDDINVDNAGEQEVVHEEIVGAREDGEYVDGVRERERLIALYYA